MAWPFDARPAASQNIKIEKRSDWGREVVSTLLARRGWGWGVSAKLDINDLSKTCPSHLITNK